MGGVNVKNTMIEGLLQMVAPHPCFGCGKIGTPICANCKYNITSEPFVGCVLCGKPNRGGICRLHTTAITQAWVVGQRQDTLRSIIDAYKFHYMKSAAKQLAEILHESLPLFPADTVIVPIPTVAAHIRERGFDHIDVLARHFAYLRGYQIERVLRRHSFATQHRLDRKQRQNEAKNAFTVLESVKSDVPYLVVDDIITTGSTVSAAATALVESGAKGILVAALAYQPLD